jgi:hypothetical protein
VPLRVSRPMSRRDAATCGGALKLKENFCDTRDTKKPGREPGFFSFCVVRSALYAKWTDRKRARFNRIDNPLVMPRPDRASTGAEIMR